MLQALSASEQIAFEKRQTRTISHTDQTHNITIPSETA